MTEKLTTYCIVSGLIVSLASFQFGYKLSELNNIKDPIISCDLNAPRILNVPVCLPMSDTYFGLVTSIFAIGGLVGAFFGGYCSEKYGRKKYLVFNALFFLVGSLIELFATTPGMLVAGRFISGLGSGGGVVTAPMYLTEIATVSSRGFLNTFNQMLIVTGIFIAQLMGYFFNTGNRWRYVIVLAVVSSVVNMLTMLLVVESPKYLISKGKLPEARIALSRLRGTSFVDDEISSWERADSKLPESPHLDDLEPENKESISLIKILFMKKYRLSLILVFSLMTSQQLSGINTVFFYSNSIFSKMFSQSLSAILTLVVGAINVIFTMFTVFIMDKIGRKTFLLISMGSMAVSLAILTISLVLKVDILSVVAIYLTTISFITGLGALPYLIATELFDQRGMSAGNTVSISANWIWTFVIGVSFFSLQERLGDYVFILFIGFLLLFSSFFYIFLPETKDKTYNVVAKEFKF
ncbi:Solute carrier family 2, facilitated glucose transporter member 3 [Smittium mucronatum]|uniref:Solute carrier family 2, facilitated glucose transporter member 3 n=1 Tax=Smittium mucronatum TaxID=133383 RepID=A0A1R0GNX1_9FUNG|nr:Solute carrier family 2, facilitated glucose transporter member 3 [Smittium mucronatum]OLY82233.1 Solute carrier family 2, facilitated glucose transporter member 3 [Smittium mucronatum]